MTALFFCAPSAAVLLVNRVPPGEDASFFSVHVQFPERTLRFAWRGQDVVVGRTRLQAGMWHHVRRLFLPSFFSLLPLCDRLTQKPRYCPFIRSLHRSALTVAAAGAAVWAL